jgi:hypothetical protein
VHKVALQHRYRKKLAVKERQEAMQQRREEPSRTWLGAFIAGIAQWPVPIPLPRLWMTFPRRRATSPPGTPCSYAASGSPPRPSHSGYVRSPLILRAATLLRDALL